MSGQYAVIMAGGSGTRLWPMSRSDKPKQLLKLHPNGISLLQISVERLRGIFDPKNIYIIATAGHIDPIAKETPEIPKENLIGEPIGQDTANAVGLSAAILAERDPDCTIGIFTADHIIEPIEKFHSAVKTAFQLVEKNPQTITTFGIKPTTPHTGLGYIHRGEPLNENCYKVQSFKEKPDKPTAENYLASGEYYWNSGMFVWKAKTILYLLKTHLPENAGKLIALAANWPNQANEIYPTLKKISIDFAVMEKAKNAAVVELDCRWADVGSWSELQNLTGLDKDNNAILAKTLTAIDTKNSVIVSTNENHMIALIGVEDMIIIHTDDATLICPKSQAQQIKTLVANLESQNGKKYT